MLILALDTSTRIASIAFLRDGHVLDTVSSCDEAPCSSRVFRDLALLRSRTEFRMDQIDVFAVGTGPGSFTGLRVGLTAVKAWAEVHRKPIAAISGLEAIAAQAMTNGDQRLAGSELLAPYLDARRGQVFGSTYRRVRGSSTAVELLGGEAILTAEEFLFVVKENLGAAHALLISPTPDVLPRALVDSILPGARIKEVSPILAPVFGRLAFDRASCGELVDSLGLDANYIRRTDAEVFWKGGG
jgi:tRNA threonylcarbamoyladenosine biosynthesis protein TsaB